MRRIRRTRGANMWKATAGESKRRWSLETTAGSKRKAWTETEASWHLGDPPPSWSVENGPSMSTEWINLRETEATGEVALAGRTQTAAKPRPCGRSQTRWGAGPGARSLDPRKKETHVH